MDYLSKVLQLHTPEELQYFSNLAHWVEGALFLLVAGIALLEVLGYLKSKKSLYIYPWVLIIAGLFLPIFMFGHHLGEQLKLAWQVTIYVPQQRQHFIMAILILISGIAELRSRQNPKIIPWLKFVMPTVFVVIGVMFIVHPQHGATADVIRAITIHRYLGTVLILSGLFKGLGAVWNKKVLAFSWIFFLFLASILLITYREPAGTYMLDTQGSENMNMDH